MPDWQDASDYKFTSHLDDVGWTWEFMRRNPKYRQDYAAAAKTLKPKSQGFFLSHNAPSVDMWWPLGAKWWIKGPIRDPAGDVPPLYFRHFPLVPNSKELKSFFRRTADADDWEGADPDDIPKEQLPEFVTLVFQLRKPLGAQIARASQLLKQKQSIIPSAAVKAPPHKGSENWTTYLRLLDAREAKVPFTQIAATLLAGKFMSKTGYDPVKKIQKQWSSAKSLRDNPLALLDWCPPIPEA
jgi:hypothetical protein